MASTIHVGVREEGEERGEERVNVDVLERGDPTGRL